MIHYHLSSPQPTSHWLNIDLTIDHKSNQNLELAIAAWRPGRYEFQNYAGNIRDVRAVDASGIALNIKKTSRNQWLVETDKVQTIKVSYQYYCEQMDAGACWIDETQWYLNPINCCMYLPEHMFEEHKVTFELPKNYKIACGIPYELDMLLAEDFYELADSPLIASATMLQEIYQIGDINFTIWIQGNVKHELETIAGQFEQFSQYFHDHMGDFPFREYHFLFQILPYKHYHGVEHRNSTVITLGPDTDFMNEAFQRDLLGISSHELFHAWNICKIRPIEMMPYHLNRENYFETGFVAEGITTYWGDRALFESGVYDHETYLLEINAVLKRHFENFGITHSSLAESSFDLWIDGYKNAAPDRKVSIYDKGAVFSLILDFKIRAASHGKHHLGTLMQKLWSQYGKRKMGYTYDNVVALANELTNHDLSTFFEKAIYQKTDLKDELQKIGHYDLVINESENFYLNSLGCKFDKNWILEKIDPASPAIELLSKHDQLITINHSSPENYECDFSKKSVSLLVKRYGRDVSLEIPISKEASFFNSYGLALKNE